MIMTGNGMACVFPAGPLVAALAGREKKRSPNFYMYGRGLERSTYVLQF
jgi:hypothetical protein